MRIIADYASNGRRADPIVRALFDDIVARLRRDPRFRAVMAWLSFGDIPLRGFCVVAPYNKLGAAICSGLCENCFDQPNLLQRSVERYRTIWPDIYTTIVCPPPAEVQ